jgi:hypothetical protein
MPAHFFIPTYVTHARGLKHGATSGCSFQARKIGAINRGRVTDLPLIYGDAATAEN